MEVNIIDIIFEFIKSITLIKAIGWLGSACFAICGFPQAFKSYQDKNSLGITWWLIILWGLGELLTLIYVIANKDLPLIFNYAFNLISLSIILWFKIFPKSN